MPEAIQTIRCPQDEETEMKKNTGEDKSSTTGMPGCTRAQGQGHDGSSVRRSGNDRVRARGPENEGNEVESICHYDSPLGGITMRSDGAAL